MENERINVYVCDDLHKTVTRDVDEGVTPFMIECDVCGKLAKSSFYKNPENLTPTYEWYKPSSFEGLTEAAIDHVKNGGLIRRKIESTQ